MCPFNSSTKQNHSGKIWVVDIVRLDLHITTMNEWYNCAISNITSQMCFLRKVISLERIIWARYGVVYLQT